MDLKVVKEWGKSLPEDIDEILVGRVLDDSEKWIDNNTGLSDEDKKEYRAELKKWEAEEREKIEKKKKLLKEIQQWVESRSDFDEQMLRAAIKRMIRKSGFSFSDGEIEKIVDERMKKH
ncbi:MAG: hypothetical protein PHD51_01250 [Patescibacteria group bacterium]|nr:hypothetical protein [Patescibacteria group bacterium]MDD5490514.1 hypothetical protein [Patescibacteria group bacterium]